MMRMTMTDMADAADAAGQAFRLENADTWLTLPEHVLEATRSAVGVDEYNSYLPLRGLEQCRRAIAGRYEADLGLSYDPDREVVVTSGAGEAMLNALLVLIDPVDRVMITNPTYSGMAQRVRLAGGLQSFAALRAADGRWSLDRDAARRADEGAKAIFFASPCMPTGTVFTESETALLAELAVENDAWLIFNGHADRVAFDGRRVINPATLPGMRERTVLIGCMSKNYGMPGWRIGWNAGPREVMGPLEDTHIFNGIMPSGFAQAGATAALAGSQEWQLELVSELGRRRDALIEELAAAPVISAIPPEGGLYFLADISALGIDSTEFCERILAERGVALTPMPGWGADDFGRYAVRFIFSNEPEDRLREAGRQVAAFARSLDEGARAG
jgi:aspartate/methionine/tyrosine aminotransferase